MPIANIVVNTSSPKGPRLTNLVSAINSARDQARTLKAIMDQEWAGSDYTQLESQFGLAAGQGSVVYGLVFALTGAGGALEAAAVTNFTDRLG